MVKDSPPKAENTGNFFRELEIGFVAHELKGPLGVIEAGLRSLLERTDAYGALSPRQEKTLRRLLRSTLKSRSMIIDLLEIGQAEAGHIMRTCFQPVPVVRQTLLEAVETVASDIFNAIGTDVTDREAVDLLTGQGIFLETAPTLENIEIFQDEKKFRQILVNLIKNALRFYRQRLLIRLSANEQELIIEVCDDGPGIAREHHEWVFQPYTQVGTDAVQGKKGQGLGLAGARLLAARLGGTITLRSETGEGSVFRLSVPTNKVTHE